MTRSTLRRMVLSVVIGGLACTWATPAAVGQYASPAAGSTAGGMCTAAPRPAEELVMLWFGPEGAPLATPTPPPPVPSAAELPQGEPADEQTAAAVSATVHEIFACFDAGQYARAFALMTDNAARQFGPDVTDPTEDSPDEVIALLEAQIAGTPVADEETGEPTVISEARDVRMLDDGRVGALFESEGETTFGLFEQRGDRWLLDGFIFVMASGGTPTS